MCLLVSACGTDAVPSDPADPADPADPSDPTDGASLFVAKCSGCHGDGTGSADAPTIANVIPEFATYVVRTGRKEMGFPTGMPQFDATELSDDQLSAILDHLDATSRPTAEDALYTRFCGNCHGADGRSGRAGINITRNAGELTTDVRTGFGGDNFAARTLYMPAWSASELNDTEIGKLQSYLSTR